MQHTGIVPYVTTYGASISACEGPAGTTGAAVATGIADKGIVLAVSPTTRQSARAEKSLQAEQVWQL